MAPPIRPPQEQASIIRAVQTPLGFFALTLLVIEVALMAIATLLRSPDQTYLLWGCLALIFITILLFGILAASKPRLFGVSDSVLNSNYLANNQRTTTYDLFISAPMTSDLSSYQTIRNDVLLVLNELQNSGFSKIYYAAQNIEDITKVDPPAMSTKKDLKALRESKYFLLIFPKKLTSSSLVEAGYALALRIPSIYFFHDIDDLPYMLREVPQNAASKFKYQSQDQLLFLVRKYVREIFLEDGN